MFRSTLPGLEDKNGFILLDGMAGNLSLSGFQSSIGKRLKPKPDAVMRGRLSGITDPPFNMVESQKFTLFRLGTLKNNITLKIITLKNRRCPKPQQMQSVECSNVANDTSSCQTMQI
jgi:hypothetical protein